MFTSEKDLPQKKAKKIKTVNVHAITQEEKNSNFPTLIYADYLNKRDHAVDPKPGH